MRFAALNGMQQGRDDSAGAFGQMRVNDPGDRLGQLAKTLGIDPSLVAMTPAAEAAAKVPGQNKAPVDAVPDKPTQQPLNGQLTLGGVFANEIVRRLESGQEGSLDLEGQHKDADDLRHSLGRTMDWIRDRFGDETAAAAAGMVLQSTSSGVTEDSLSNGLLNTLRFIDRNFGFAAGDEAIGRFNSNLNGALNDYFDNGSEELFYAVETPADGGSPVQNFGTRIFFDTVENESEKDDEAKSPTEKLLDTLKEDLDEAAELQDMTTQVDVSASTAVQANFALNAYADQPAPAEPQFTSQAV